LKMFTINDLSLGKTLVHLVNLYKPAV
ncbi:MAG: hypothetical protein RLZZ333_1880, partial [Bacteroidota bacterium]